MIDFIAKIKRFWWQITGTVVFNLPFIGPLSLPWFTVPVLNCYSCPLAQGACPIGTIQHFLVIGMIPFFAIGVIGLFGLFAGRFYCSHLCPFGFFQDILKRVTSKHIRIPAAAEYGKYVVLLVLMLLLPPLVKEPFFCTLCPAGTLEAGIPVVTGAWLDSRAAAATPFGAMPGILNMIGWWFWFKISILVAFIAAATVVRRPFCRTACPLGAILGLFNRISFIIHPPLAQDSGKRPVYRLKNCPVGITHPDKVDSPACIKCRECYRR